MARPRVFISSTFYDLRYVREDLERFITTLGYEPIRHEAGGVAYGKEAPLEESAYREVAFCDIIVCIIGGRYGSESATREGSVTQNELEEALRKGVQVYVFVEQNVHGEYATYKLNKDNKGTRYQYVDNVGVYDFLERIYALPQNNPITPFSTSADICSFLRSQWSGLFQRFLQEEKRVSEIQVLEELKSVAKTLRQLVTFLTEERRSKDDAIKAIILANHPAFRVFAKLTGTPYRVFFTNRDELDKWLEARRYTPVSGGQIDDDSVAEWASEHQGKYIKLAHNLFDADDRLIPLTEEDWRDEWVQRKELPPTDESDEEEIPF